MGWGKGYGNYRSDEQREGPVFYVLYGICLGFIVLLFFWGYFGVGSGTHYMYSLGDDDDVIRFL